MMNIPKVIDLVVNNDLCIGCGLCTYKCSNDTLKMNWSENGLLVPTQINDCLNDGDCLTVCPFNPFPDEKVKTENELSDIFLSETTQKSKEIGRFNAIYTGYSKKYRLI